MRERKKKPPLFGLLAEFESPDVLRQAALKVHDLGYRCMDAYTPFPVEGIGKLCGSRKKPISIITLIGGLVGGLGGFYMQYWIEAVTYPLNVGGRPYDSIPSFIPVTFELTILGGALSAFIGMLALNGLPRPYHPLFNVKEFALASRDRFFLCIQSDDPQFSYQQTRELLASLGPHSVSDVPY